MKVFIIASVHDKKEFQKQKDKRYFLSTQGQQSWVYAFQKLGVTVSVFRPSDDYIVPTALKIIVSLFFEKVLHSWKRRYHRFWDKFYFLNIENHIKNKNLLSRIDQFKPELLIISGGISSIFPATIKKIKNKYRVPILLFSGVDPLIGSSRSEIQMLKNKAIDMVVVNDGGFGQHWKKMGAKKVIVLPISSVDPKLHMKYKLSKNELKEYSCDVCFVGTLTKQRQDTLKLLTNFDLKIWGEIPSNIGIEPQLVPYYQGKAHGKKMIKIFNAAKIVLNFQHEMKSGGNMRMFEASGAGAFQITNKLGEGWFRDGKEIVLYRNISDLKSKISYYLQHENERKIIADAAYNLSHEKYSYVKRFQRLLALI